MKTKRTGLGRGLDAILQSPDTDITSTDISGEFVVGAIASISLEKIEANPFQPRDSFEQSSLLELAASIKEQGVIQPVTVRKLGYDKYQLISGERRLRAAKIAELSEIPCFIRLANDQQMLELALIENVHREDLNPIEIALSYQRLIEECNLTQEKLSERVSKNRVTITNFLRLLKLHPKVQIALRDKQITVGHARALISIVDQDRVLELLQDIIENGLSVRQVEESSKNPEAIKPKKIRKNKVANDFDEYISKLNKKYGFKVAVTRNPNGRGKVLFSFRNEDELKKLIELLDR